MATYVKRQQTLTLQYNLRFTQQINQRRQQGDNQEANRNSTDDHQRLHTAV